MAMKMYSEEFRREAVGLVQLGEKSVSEIANDLGVSVSTLRIWVAAVAPPAEHHGETPEQELKRLRNENRILKMERDILKKAAAFFAKENR